MVRSSWNDALTARFGTATVYKAYTAFVADDHSGLVLYASAIKLLEEPPNSRRYCRGFKKYNGREIVSQ